MNGRRPIFWRWGQALCLAFLAGGCLTARTERSAAEPGPERGFFVREGLALWRIVSMPYPVLVSCCQGCEELVVGCWELLTCSQVTSSAYPSELVGTVSVERTESGSQAQAAGGASARPDRLAPLEATLRRACASADWKTAAATCRQIVAKSPGDCERALNGVRLALANWNAGDRVDATIAMDLVVAKAARIGPRAAEAALKLRADIRAGNVPERFDAEAIAGRTGLAIYDIISSDYLKR